MLVDVVACQFGLREILQVERDDRLCAGANDRGQHMSIIRIW